METIVNILGNIGFDWRVALANLVNFLIIFWLLDRFIFSKIKLSLKNRKQVIQKSVEDAQKAERELVMAEEKKKDILKEARLEANLIFDDAHKKAKQTINSAVKDAEKESEKVMTEAKTKIAKQKSEIEKQVQKETVDMVVEGVQKVLLDEMDSSMQERVIKRITT